MPTQSNLIVFDGPDGVGKSTLSREVVGVLSSRGISCDLMAFPCNEPGSLGAHVRTLLHEPSRFGIANISPTSLHALCVAAHVDTVVDHVLPALAAGRWVVLDSFWWSAWASGLAMEVDQSVLDALVAVDRNVWGGVLPDVAFLVQRIVSPNIEPTGYASKLFAAFHQIAVTEQALHQVIFLENNGPVTDAVRRAIEAIDARRHRVAASRRATKKKRAATRRSVLLDSPNLFSTRKTTDELGAVSAPAQGTVVGFYCPLAPAKPSKVYATYWKFAAERQAVFFRRLEGVAPLTADSILARHKFCNAYRASDRVSQYLIRNVIYQHDQSPEELFFRIILFKLFNKIETWELLERSVGIPCYAEFDLDRYATVFDQALERGQAIYSGAYIMPSGSGGYEDARKHRSHLRLLQRMMQNQLPRRVAECSSMRQAFELIVSYPMIGDFLAYQYVSDLNYSELTNFTEMEFVVPGPGARDGIRKCFSSLGGLSEEDVISLVAENQERELERLGVNFRFLWGRRLQLIDCQNLFCETDKYARLAHPEIQGISGRTKIKQNYRPHSTPISFWYPPKWNINEAVAATQACVHRTS